MIKVKEPRIKNKIKAYAEIDENGNCSSVFVEIINELLNNQSDIGFFAKDDSNNLSVLNSDSSVSNFVTVDPHAISYKFILSDGKLEDINEYFINLRFSDKEGLNSTVINYLSFSNVETILKELMSFTGTVSTNFKAREFNQIITEKLQQLHFEFTDFLTKNNAKLVE